MVHVKTLIYISLLFISFSISLSYKPCLIKLSFSSLKTDINSKALDPIHAPIILKINPIPDRNIKSD